MHVLICQARFALGGTETYTATVAEQLENLGHTVTVHAVSASERGRELIAARALRLEVAPEPPREQFDAAIVQDTGAAYLLAGREPPPRQLFVIHGMAAFERPAVALQPSPPIVVMNDRNEHRARSFAGSDRVVRLRQPIDILRHRPRGSARRRARRVLALSNSMHEWRLRTLESVCTELGLELDRVGADDPSAQPEDRIAAADIVVGYGRAILEGMAMGKAAYIWDRGGGDGWVTPETYPAFEADGFSGSGSESVIGAERLKQDLASYRPELGDLSYDLVRQHHAATRHTEELLKCLTEAEPAAAPDAFETIAMLVRAERRATARAEGAEHVATETWEGRAYLLGQAEQAEAARVALEARSSDAELRMREAELRLEEIIGSRSWRATSSLRRLGQRLRRR